MVDGIGHGLIFEWHAVEFSKVLLYLMLAQELRRAEPHLVGSLSFGRPSKYDLVTDEFLLGSWCFKPGRDCWLDALGAKVLFKFQPLLVVFVELVQVLFVCFRWSFEIAKVLGVEISDLHRVPQLEVNLIRVEAKSFHC